MKKITKLMFAIAILVVASCTQQKPEAETKADCCKNESKEANTSKTTGFSDASLFWLDSSWENQNGDSLSLKQFEGKVIVAAMIFTHCPTACPRIVSDMKSIEAALTADEKKQVQFLLLSMDPTRDTPERMQEFANDHRLGADWQLVRTNQNGTTELAHVLGVKVKPLAEGGFDHSNIINILNREGEIVSQQNGLNLPAEPSLEAIRKVIAQ